MMRKSNKSLVMLAALAGMVGMSMNANALPDINFKKGGRPLLKSAAGCKEAQATIDLNINNVRARIMTGGDMWYDRGTGTAQYEIPNGSGKNSLFAGSSWIGGYDAQGQLKVAAQTYRQNGNDYWPGPLDPDTKSIDAATCSEWDRFWRVDKSVINSFKELIRQGPDAVSDPKFDVIKEWPAKGNGYAKGANGNRLSILTASTFDYAPFVDVNGDGNYDYKDGDYPDITGDQYIWWVFNDKGNIKGETKTDAIGLEVQTSAFAYSTKDALNDASFFIYRIINRGPLTMDSTYMATWTDADLGYAFDDYIGCDTVRGLGIEYNGNSIDGSGGPGTYGNHVPMVGVDFFKGPHKYIHMPDGTIKDSLLSMQAFTYFNNDNGNYGNPTNGVEIYNYMTGSDRKGEIFNNDFHGPGIPSNATTAGPKTRFVFFGDPDKDTWSECTCGNPVGDRRFIHSAGAFQLIPGAVNDLIIGSCWVADVGGCPNTSFKKIRAADDVIQSLFEAGFKTTEGPEAPRVTIREMDRKLVFYLFNDPESNNYKEQYGYVDSPKYRVPSTKAKNYVHAADSLYKFEGYRVFQLKSSEVGPGQIYNSDGSLNTDVAAEVFQCDIKNGVKRIVNYNKETDISDTTWQAVVKVEGKDSGIVHSFALTTDAFATTDDKRLVNYKNYYYVVIAYAYNNFAPFDPSGTHADSTQDVPYLESLHGPNGTSLIVYTPMPNPANGAMGTTLNADYGSGIVIHKLEGIGNGGNIVDLDAATEEGAFSNGSIIPSKDIVYQAGAGPVDVKVVDPQKVKAANWELYLTGKVDTITSTDVRIVADSNSGWKLVNTDANETIYSERSLAKLNEQLIEDYGLSVNIAQVVAPGEDEPDGNGYLTSLVMYDDETKPWLAGVSSNKETNSFLAVENWIRTGNTPAASITNPFRNCNFGSFGFDTVGAYANMFANTTLTKSTWAPYALASIQSSKACQFGVAYTGSVNKNVMNGLHSVDLVFTPDKSKWTHCAVIEEQADPDLADHNVKQFSLRSHKSWTGDVDASGSPVYSETDTGMSYFPGYAIDEETGQRLNIIFGEDSYLKTENGGDMIWNPTSNILNDFSGDPLFGGKHYVYISSTQYDEDTSFVNIVKKGSSLQIAGAYQKMMWVGIPTINPDQHLLPLKDNLIPTVTRLKFRVSRPYGQTESTLNKSSLNGGLPHYQFSTADLAPTPLSDAKDDKSAVLKRINVTPNPYYGYTGYESSRLDTRVRIINLPHKASIDIYSLDGTLIRHLTKDDANTSYIDWDVRNAKGLPIASGMYLIHVNAEGIGETVLRWFGAMRPLDITSY